MKLLALLPIAATAISVSLDADLKQMRESLRGIALAAKKEGKQVNETTIGVVRAMLTTINSTLVDALHIDKQAAQASLSAALADVNACKTAREGSFTGAIDGENTAQGNAHDAFYNCKNGEDAPEELLQQKAASRKHRHHRDTPDGQTIHSNHDYGYDKDRAWHTDGEIGHTSHEVHAHSEEERLCALLNNTVKGYAAQVEATAHADYCEDHDANNWTDLFRTNLKLVTESYNWFEPMDRFEAANAQDYKDKRDACHLARHRHVVRVVECNRLQHAYETAYCTYANTIDEVCHLYETCYDAQYAAWDLVNTTAQNLEDQMKAQQEALEHLLCYGNEIMQGSTDLSNCDSIADNCDKCDDYCLDYVPPHTEVVCGEALGDFRPCGDEWCNTNMGEFFGSSHPLDECIACSDPVLVDWSA